MSRGTMVGIAGLWGAVFVQGDALGYSTKLHMITGQHVVDLLRKYDCKVPLFDWNKGNKQAKSSYLKRNPGGAHIADLTGEICRVVKSKSQYFVSATTGPDTFPGMFGNTDPTHAKFWNTAWQTAVLWQNAKSDEEKAFALGWLVHFAGDLNAHGLANLHAHGVWMEGGKMSTVWRHILSETYYAKFMLPYPKDFNNKLIWPDRFVTKMFYNPHSPLYQHYDYLATRLSDDIGGVAQAFGAVYRLIFLLWDFHARKQNVWQGRKDYYRPIRKKSVANFLQWIVADQVYHFHRRKTEKLKALVERWQTATHQAQQAIVADKDGQVVGKGGKRGAGGVLKAYGYLKTGIFDYLKADFPTITEENFPLLNAVVQAAKRVKAVAVALINAVKAVIHFFQAIVAKIKEAILKVLDPYIQKAKNWVANKAICTPMPEMCRAINAQKHSTAFDVRPGDMQSYMNWPIYRNTITAAVLLLEQLKKMKKSGDELDSPLFGLPSGDFGCTGSCIQVRKKYARLFMPAAGDYYRSAAVQKALPDYCMIGSDARRSEPINEKYQGKTNDVANGGFTCFQAGSPCSKADDAYAMPRKKASGKVGKILEKVFEKIKGRWDFDKHTPKGSGRYVRAKGQKSVCYEAFSFGPSTIVTKMADPVAFHASLNKKEPYSLGLDKLPKPLQSILNQPLSVVEFLKQKVAGSAQIACKVACSGYSMVFVGKPAYKKVILDSCLRACGVNP